MALNTSPADGFRDRHQTPDTGHPPSPPTPDRPGGRCHPVRQPRRVPSVSTTKYVREHARAASGQRTGLQTQQQPPARAATLRGRLAISAGAAWSRRRPGRSLTSPICLPPARPYRGVASAHIRRRGIVVTSLRGRTANEPAGCGSHTRPGLLPRSQSEPRARAPAKHRRGECQRG